MPEHPLDPISVSELNVRAKRLLEAQLGHIRVEGELTNFSRPASGHWYFTLKDDNAQIRCAMFRNRNSGVKTIPSNGDQVVINGRISLYEPRGDYQLIADKLEAAGEGLLQQHYERLKQKLEKEGLFSETHKKALPDYASKVAIVSSATGAALQDILHVLKRRNPAIEIVVVPSSVQGKEAANELVYALKIAENLEGIDAIILSRGGGSLEDLWPFNDENLARKIFSCPIPIVSAVGHEVDFSISDFVADVRAPTPSAAAELVSADIHDMIDSLAVITGQLEAHIKQHIRQYQYHIQHLDKRLKHPGEKINHWQQRTDICAMRLDEAMRKTLDAYQYRKDKTQARLTSVSPKWKLTYLQQEINQLDTKIHTLCQRFLAQKTATLDKLAMALDIASPLATLKRGYSISRGSNQRLVTSIHNCDPGENLTVEFHDGYAETKIFEKREKPKDL